MTDHIQELKPVLLKPLAKHLTSYTFALNMGWSPDNLRPEVAQEQREWILRDPTGFLNSMDDSDAKGRPVRLPDGSEVPRLPGIKRWIWDEGFCGTIGLRWQPGRADLPPHCLGHIGYAIVPWRRNEGLATRALREILPYARSVGLAYVDLSADPENHASIRVMEKAGARFVETITTPAALGARPNGLYRVDL